MINRRSSRGTWRCGNRLFKCCHTSDGQNTGTSTPSARVCTLALSRRELWLAAGDLLALDCASFSSGVNLEVSSSFPTQSNSNSWQQVRRSEEHTSELQSLMRISYAVFSLKK